MVAKVNTIITMIETESQNLCKNTYEPSIRAWARVISNFELLSSKEITETQRTKKGKIRQAQMTLEDIYHTKSPELFILCGLAVSPLVLGSVSRKTFLQQLKASRQIDSTALAKLEGISLYLKQSTSVKTAALAQIWQQQSSSHLSSLNLRHVYQFSETPIDLIPLLAKEVISAIEAGRQYQHDIQGLNKSKTNCIKILSPEDPLEDGEIRIKVGQDEALKLSHAMSQRLISRPS